MRGALVLQATASEFAMRIPFVLGFITGLALSVSALSPATQSIAPLSPVTDERDATPSILHTSIGGAAPAVPHLRRT